MTAQGQGQHEGLTFHSMCVKLGVSTSNVSFWYTWDVKTFTDMKIDNIRYTGKQSEQYMLSFVAFTIKCEGNHLLVRL